MCEKTGRNITILSKKNPIDKEFDWYQDDERQTAEILGKMYLSWDDEYLT